jgi:hypothetical protein
MADGGKKLSNCLEYLLFVAEVGGARLAECGGRGEPAEVGVYV